MERVKAFLKRKQVVISVQTYLIDALGAMAFGSGERNRQIGIWRRCCYEKVDNISFGIGWCFSMG